MQPAWARELAVLYESGAHSQFLLHGNVNDRVLVPGTGSLRLDGLVDYIAEVLMPGFDVVLSYDIGNGIRVEKGEALFAEWPFAKRTANLPRDPRPAVEVLTHYFRYVANYSRIGGKQVQVGCLIKGAQLVAPGLQGGFHNDVSAIASLIRDWATDTVFTNYPLATVLIVENLNDLNPIVVNNPRVARLEVALPEPVTLARTIELLATSAEDALGDWCDRGAEIAGQLVGASLSSIESLVKTRQYRKQPIVEADLSELKKQLVENDANGLIEFLESHRSLDDLAGQDGIKDWLRQDIALWRKGESEAMPMGYLLCGPVGTGKTFMVECLAGEAGVPIVKLKNFRDKWVGSSEGNLEKIFRLLHALGRCYVFIDEADQSLGKRNSGDDSSGVSGRLYSMMAQEMSRPENRGRIVWILASSRPDLIEVDLKRPGRVDVKIPIFPTVTAKESFDLIRALLKKKDLSLPKAAFTELQGDLPLLVTPGAAEALAMKAYRLVKTKKQKVVDALQACLTDYRAPVAEEVMSFQIGLAMAEATDPSFVPAQISTDFGKD